MGKLMTLMSATLHPKGKHLSINESGCQAVTSLTIDIRMLFIYCIPTIIPHEEWLIMCNYAIRTRRQTLMKFACISHFIALQKEMWLQYSEKNTWHNVYVKSSSTKQ